MLAMALGALVAAVGWPLGEARAQSGAACEELRITAAGEGRIVSYHEVGPDGPGPGDVRPGLRNLVDDDGNTIGQLRWYETLIGPDGDPDGGSVSVVRYYVMLPEGMILAENLNLAQKPRADLAAPPIEAAHVIILGGTGVYAGARGTMKQTVGVDGDPLKVVYDVEFVC